MGGKNCVIVDSDADPDEVVPALVASAFNYAGQKCSAAARVLCHEAIHDTLVERLAGAVELLEVGPAESLSTEVPAVIEPDSRDRHARFAVRRRAGSRQASATFLATASTRPPPCSPTCRRTPRSCAPRSSRRC